MSKLQVTIGRKEITLRGHAPEAVVCHAISGITDMVALYAQGRQLGEVEAGDGYLSIRTRSEQDRGHPIFVALTEALQQINRDYPGNLTIRYGED